jgi:hypothetical protein
MNPLIHRTFLGLFVLLLTATFARAAAPVAIVLKPDAAPRVQYGADRLADALKSAGYEVSTARSDATPSGRRVIVSTLQNDDALRELLRSAKIDLKEGHPGREGFVLANCPGDVIAVAGADDSGALYGCLELARRVKEAGKLPADLHVIDAPTMVLRGACIGMQKPYLLPGRKTYEYPYTPDLFPFFYDESFWREYLDFLAANRMNTLYLWNGWPFASLVRVKDYPDAVEVPDDVFERNVKMFRYITREADRRGIWVVQMFYSIIVSKPFAEKHGLPTQLSHTDPVAGDYVRKSIAEFVRSYPNVGLLVCLGEALQDNKQQVEWFRDVILPGVKDGMKAAGIQKEPPIIVRAHATDPEAVMKAGLPVYHNLYTMAKYNGESLTTWEPRGPWQQVHLKMGHLGSTHLVNIHILANLEPFRYGDVRFIQKCVQAARDRLGARGVHLYPIAYWDWPNTADKTNPLLKNWRRDWIWFEAWARYSWNPDRDAAGEQAYWTHRLTEMYGSPDAAARILEAYDDSGECAPRLLRRFGITEGNRQTLSLGMTLDELVNPAKYKAFKDLWESQSPPGERLQEYVDREWKHEPHEGETPPQIIRESLDYSARAVEAIDAAEPLVTNNRAEFERLRNDVHCIREMTQFYAAKANAAMLVLRYGYSKDITDMQKAADYMAESLEHYKKLAQLTADTYRYANSMQTSQRKIPVPGGIKGKPANYHWTQLVGLYETELANFRKRVEELQHGPAVATTPRDEAGAKPLQAVPFTLLGNGAETYKVETGAKVFTDRDFAITSLAPELRGLTGIRFSHEAAKKGKPNPIEFEVDQPVQVLVGYFKATGKGWLQVPNLETDAPAGEYIETMPALENAVTIPGMPAVDVHVFKYDKGRHTLDVRGRGSFLILGMVPQSAHVAKRQAKQ